MSRHHHFSSANNTRRLRRDELRVWAMGQSCIVRSLDAAETASAQASVWASGTQIQATGMQTLYPHATPLTWEELRRWRDEADEAGDAAILPVIDRAINGDEIAEAILASVRLEREE